MKHFEVSEVNDERLQGWAKRLTEKHATAYFIFGVTQEGSKEQAGQCVVITTDTPDDKLLEMAKELVRELEYKLARKN